MDARLYLHFGDLPASGRSVCYTLTDGTWDEGRWADLSDERRAEFEAVGYSEIDGRVYEPGLSVYSLDWDSRADDDELVFHVAESSRQMVAEMIEERPALLVSGCKVTDGFDGEPVIEGVELVGPARVVRFDRRKGLIHVQRG